MIAVFDLFGVVISWASADVLPEWVKIANVSEKEFKERSRDVFVRAETGKIDMDAFWVEFAAEFSVKPHELKAAFLKTFAERAKPNKDVLAIVRSCPKKVLLSNQLPIHAELCAPTLEEFDNVFLSFKLGAMKPSKEIYQKVQDALGVPANDLILIDDKKENVDAAIACGWQGVVFKGVEGLEKQMRNYLEVVKNRKV